MLFKTLGSFLLVSAILISARARTGDSLINQGEQLMAANESCGESIDNHIGYVEASEKYFSLVFGSTPENFSAFEITKLQKVLELRYNHLIKVQEKFKSPTDCNLVALGNVLAVYDFNLLAESTMQNDESRRMVYSMVKSEDYGMKDFKKDYNHFTKLSTIEEIRNGLTQQELGLLSLFGLNADHDKEGTQLSTMSDRLKRVWGWVIGKGLVRTWGLLSDNLKVRHGYLRDDVTVREDIRSKLKPLDLMFEQRRFVLSNLTIPGHWGHVAVWLGTKEELQALGVWDREDFKFFRAHVEQGKNIVQMRKEGVVFNSLEEFMNLDEIAVTRLADVQNRKAAIYPLLANHLNKKYDFSFDAKSLGKITCTEFIAFSYGDITWPDRIQLGRTVIAPDDMAKLTLDASQSELVMYVGSDNGQTQIKNSKDWLSGLGVHP